MFGISAFAQTPFAALGEDSGVSVALTGVAASGTVGTVSRGDTSLALTGVFASGTIGTVAPSISDNENGDVATGNVGTVGVSVSKAITGVAASGNVGTLTNSRTVALAGNSATGSVGTTVANSTVTITGVFAAGAAGTVSDKGIGTNITGNAAAGAVGTVSSNVQVALSGVEAAGQVAFLILPLKSLIADGNVGSVQTEFSFDLTSAAATGAVSSVGVGNRTVALTGVSAAGSVGTLIPVYWQVIDDSQTANWIAINSIQTPGWSTIQDTQTANWVLVNNST
jgi:hypothetical protein